MSNDTGGPAFPVSYDHDTFQPSHVDEAKQLMSGMTLRDYFAAQAMQASRSRQSQYVSWDDLAKDSYEIADAMLAARVKP